MGGGNNNHNHRGGGGNDNHNHEGGGGNYNNGGRLGDNNYRGWVGIYNCRGGGSELNVEPFLTSGTECISFPDANLAHDCKSVGRTSGGRHLASNPNRNCSQAVAQLGKEEGVEVKRASGNRPAGGIGATRHLACGTTAESYLLLSRTITGD